MILNQMSIEKTDQISLYSDEDCSGSIDREELQRCLQKLHLNVTEEEIDDLFCACDIDESEGIQLNEFTVLLCLFYFLTDSSASSHSVYILISPCFSIF